MEQGDAAMMDGIPEEDKYLMREPTQPGICKHDWMDMYAGSGITKNDPTIALQAFFCKKCLVIRIKEWDQSRYKLRADVWDDAEE
jgi:hypothetical protein